MDALEAIAARKSTRKYLPQPVEREKTAALVAAGKSAPKSGEFHITVVENKELLQEFNDKTLEALKNSENEYLKRRASLEGYQPLYG
ncbi:MAG TPA: nitroreductase, partial [Firmicutes bacterium]|nr:nitroreductase [Bacillota bacterium]